MRRVFFIVLLFVLGSTRLFSQTGDTIQMHNVFGGAVFMQDEKRLTIPEVLQIMEPNINAYEVMLSARNSFVMATVFNAIGGGLIGFPLGVALGGGEPNWNVALVGAGMIAISVPFIRSYKIKARSAVNTYNDGLDFVQYSNKTELDFLISANGIGLSLKF